MSKTFCRCVLVTFQQCLHSVAFSPLPFLDTGTHQILKLTGASAISHTPSLGSPLPHAASATFTLLLDMYRGTKDDGHGTWADGSCSSHFPSVLLYCG